MEIAFVRSVTRDLEEDGRSMRVEAPDTAVTETEAFAAIEERTLVQVQRGIERLKTEYLDRFGSQLNADNASELFQDYVATFKTRALLGPPVRKAAATVVDALFRDLIDASKPADALRLVVFTPGGNGAGKTSSLASRADTQAYLQFDSTLSLLDPTFANIERALAAGCHVLVSYVWRDPVDALVNGTLPRAMRIGRTVPLSSHSRTHPGARRTVLRLLQQYRNDPRVTIAVFENSVNDADPRLLRRDEDWLRAQPEDRPEMLADRLRAALIAEQAAERINSAVHRGTMGSMADA